MRDQLSLLGLNEGNAFSSQHERSDLGGGCAIVPVAKRRDGGVRYWCLRHRADATAKYGRQAEACRAAHLPGETEPAFELDIDQFKGGIALWGAVPPVYDTTRLPLDKGIHMHARRSPKDKKEIDETFLSVKLVGKNIPAGGVRIDAIDAIYYMVSSVFGFPMRQVLCTHCGEPHLDRDWFSVHPHGRHLCAACGRTFSDSVRAVGNPICGIREVLGRKSQRVQSANRPISIRQADFLGGIQVWGSNPALLWTSEAAEEEGIHLHAFVRDSTEPDVDDTFSEVEIDGVKLDPVMVRTLMAQNTLPHLAGRVQSINCTVCGTGVFGAGEMGFTPVSQHQCATCGHTVHATGRFRKTIGNPLVAILDQLEQSAPRPRQSTEMHLLPETP
jgi:hypothetical protein